MRDPEKIIRSHLQLRDKGDVEQDIRENYAEDIILIDRYDTYEGFDGVRQSSEVLKKNIPNSQFSYERLQVKKNVGYLVWSATGDGVRVRHGTDSFIIKDGKIAVQTVYYMVEEE